MLEKHDQINSLFSNRQLIADGNHPVYKASPGNPDVSHSWVLKQLWNGSNAPEMAIALRLPDNDWRQSHLVTALAYQKKTVMDIPQIELVFPFIEGTSLLRLTASGYRPDIEDIHHFAIDLLKALFALHIQAGFVHGDLALRNVIKGNDDRYYLIDVGSAQQNGQGSDGDRFVNLVFEYCLGRDEIHEAEKHLFVGNFDPTSDMSDEQTAEAFKYTILRQSFADQFGHTSLNQLESVWKLFHLSENLNQEEYLQFGEEIVTAISSHVSSQGS